MLKVKNLKKSYEGKVIWDNLNAEFKEGEIISIQGKSGEGKTTFLRCLNNLETLDSGEVIIDGSVLCQDTSGEIGYANNKELKKINKKIGMVFQNYNLFPNLTVMENLTLAPIFEKEDREAVYSRAKELLEELDIYDKKDVYPNSLSGGQKQRVAIARACMLDPKVLCFDEPTSALDDETKKQIVHIIQKLQQRDMTILIVTHDKDFSKSVSNRILHIEEGKFREETMSKVS